MLNEENILVLRQTKNFISLISEVLHSDCIMNSIALKHTLSEAYYEQRGEIFCSRTRRD